MEWNGAKIKRMNESNKKMDNFRDVLRMTKQIVRDCLACRNISRYKTNGYVEIIRIRFAVFYRNIKYEFLKERREKRKDEVEGDLG